VAAEMPADFELEALKAQAVAARTYAYGRIKNSIRQKMIPIKAPTFAPIGTLSGMDKKRGRNGKMGNAQSL